MQAQQKLTEHTLHKLFEQVRGASFAVTYKNGATEHFGDGEPQFTIRFNDDNIFNLIGDGDMLMSFGEAYMDGRVDVEGDLADLISPALRSGLASVNQTTQGFAGKALQRAAGKLRLLKHEKENIAHHYDLGNDFFRLWLDESLTYSCAYFRSDSDTIEQAQKQKIEHSLKKLRLKPNETLLDIGCGWGALVMRAAERYGAKATGITLSEEQFAGANAAIEKRGFQDKANVRLANYRTLAEEGKQFDKIISIGMIEHVGKEHLAEFVETVETLLKPNGLALLHMITGVKEGPINHWVEKYIFPGGYIPTLSEMITHLSARDFRVWDVENLAPHYRLTLDRWSERFERVVPTVLEKFDERFVRMWRLYLRASSASFREGSIEIHQILVSRGQSRDLPLTREDIYRKYAENTHEVSV
ncbi:MAG: class I SAM-dependent methyltransferase [Pyrinomonadaceae bacterium]